MKDRFAVSLFRRTLAAGALAAATAACGGGGAAAGSGQAFTIAMIAKSSTNPVFLSGRKGAEAAADSISKATGVKVRIDWLTPPNEDATVQAQRIAEAVNAGANAILLSARTTAALYPRFFVMGELAAEARAA